MKLATFSSPSQADRRIGVVIDPSTILDVGLALGETKRPEWRDMGRLIAAAPGGLLERLGPTIEQAETGRLGDAVLALGAVTLHAPIPRPARNVFCVGLNYADHIQEGAFSQGSSFKKPDFPEFFTKVPSTVIGIDDLIPRHAGVTGQLDYEGELAIVIGRGGADILAEDWADHVFGFTIVNDVTARDLQHSHKQWFKGKSLDRSCPMGPVIVTRDEIPDPSRLHLTTTVNGERRQDADLSTMIFGVGEIIQHLSRGLTLEPGDVIATGTPNGVGYARKPPALLEVGDEIVVSIPGIGELRNRVG